MVVTTNKARKSTGGTAPRKDGVAVQPPVALSNQLVHRDRCRQVSQTILYMLTVICTIHLFRNIAICAATVATCGYAIGARALCVLSTSPCRMAPIWIMRYSSALRVIRASFLNQLHIL